VFTGKGIAALQEAGKLPINSVQFFQIDALGIYPNVESLGTQATLIAIAVSLFLYGRYSLNKARPHKEI
jgi:high-affinity iron transporter